MPILVIIIIDLILTHYPSAMSKQFKMVSKASQKASNKPSYHWTDAENQVYLQYLIQHENQLSCPRLRKEKRVYSRISKVLRSRTSIQVKSHHQKMVKSYKNVKGIVQHLSFVLKKSTKTLDCSESYIVKEEEVESIALPLDDLDFEELDNFPKVQEDLAIYLVNFDYSIQNIEEEDIWDVYGEQF